MSHGAKLVLVIAILVYLLGQIAPALLTATALTEPPRPVAIMAKQLPGPSLNYTLIRELRRLETDLLQHPLTDRVAASALVGRAADRLEGR